jgi:hypothetical protein
MNSSLQLSQPFQQTVVVDTLPTAMHLMLVQATAQAQLREARARLSESPGTLQGQPLGHLAGLTQACTLRAAAQ